MMHGIEKSDPAIVAKKRTNKAGQPVTEPVERRVEAEGNAVASWNGNSTGSLRAVYNLRDLSMETACVGRIPS
jgi:hypothetical protein